MARKSHLPKWGLLVTSVTKRMGTIHSSQVSLSGCLDDTGVRMPPSFRAVFGWLIRSAPLCQRELGERNGD